MKYEKFFDPNTQQYVWFDSAGNQVTNATLIAELVAADDAECDLDYYDVYVVRLHGDRTGVSTAKIEGQGHVLTDVGNTFTLGGSGPFPEYVSYSADWLGDTNQNGVLEWNGLGYRAGFGSGTAGYAHSRLPTLTESHKDETHTNEIVLAVDQNTFVELRFKVRKP